MQSELERRRKCKERYRTLKMLRPDLYEKAVQIGSLVVLRGGEMSLAAEVEQACIDGFLGLIDGGSGA